jgi:acetolactate synthase-1/3 small subunit
MDRQSAMSQPPHPAKKYTLSALVENKPGVLNRVANLFRRRNFNIDSLTVGRTHRQHISRMTIVVDPQRGDGTRIAANLRKLVNVVDVDIISREPHVSRDLVLVKVTTDTADKANDLTEICDRYPARIVDFGPDVAILELTAPEEIIDSFIKDLQPLGILEMVRTGVVAMGRGTRILDTAYEPTIPANSNGNGYSRIGV